MWAELIALPPAEGVGFPMTNLGFPGNGKERHSVLKKHMLHTETQKKSKVKILSHLYKLEFTLL
jgi:hypothetical protein